MTFSLQWSESLSREQLAIINAGRDYVVEKRCTPGLIPIGDVPYCEAVFGRQPHFKDFYPSFLKQYLRRYMHLSDVNHMASARWSTGLPGGMFIKDATKWKSDYPPRISREGERLESFHYISGVVEFVDEWRYCVADGRVITSGWYQGEHEDALAPAIDVAWPNGFSGAVDFGTLRDGRVALVEAHAPFACGWYGDDPCLYAEWQRIAWQHSDWWKLT
jgi:hypothetical protein